ncbi:MAG: ISKra4 family transposase, partial [Chloroflexia bacterium]
CDCQPHPTKTLRPLAALLPERTSPELCYLESKWASLAAYGVTMQLLHEVLPIDEKHSANTVRNHTLRAAQRKEQMLGDEDAIYIAARFGRRRRHSPPLGHG